MRLRHQISFGPVPHSNEGSTAGVIKSGIEGASSPAANYQERQDANTHGNPQMTIRQSQLPLTRSEVIDLLHRFEVMPTSQRVQVAEVLYSKPQHLSAEQVLEKVSALGHSISRATIYNTLGLFSDKGLVKQVIIDPDRVLYDPHTAPHHHFYNSDTGELIDIEANSVEFKNMPDLPAGTNLANVDVVFELKQAKSSNDE